MIEVRLLLEGDDRSSFSSGDQLLDAHFRKYAGQNQFRHRIGATYVAVESGRILGYVTVAPGETHAESLPGRPSLPHYPIPVLRIARLAVDRAFQGQRLGEALLRYALGLALKTSSELGCAGVIVDAKPKAVEFYERYGFRRVNFIEGSQSAAPVAMFLGIHSIPAERPDAGL